MTSTTGRRYGIVTGSAAGIGLATAERLAGDGYDLLLIDRDTDGLVEAVAAVEAAGGTATTLPLDLRDGDAIAAGLETALVDRPADLLVNNAGTAVAATVPETSPAQWSAVLAVNLDAAFHTCRAVLPGMIAARHGVIVNVASVAALVGVAERAAYCASKAGLLGLTRALAVDHGRQGIRVNAVCPGTVATPWLDRVLADDPDREATRRAIHAKQLLGRIGQPEEIAATIAFLASDEAAFMTGSALVIDGGLTVV